MVIERQDAFDAFHLEARHGERHLHVQNIAENAEAGVEQDVAHLRDDFPGAGVDPVAVGHLSRRSAAGTSMSAACSSSSSRALPAIGPEKTWLTLATSPCTTSFSIGATASISCIETCGTSSVMRWPVRSERAAAARP